MIARQGIRFVLFGAFVDLVGIAGAVSGVLSHRPFVAAASGVLACAGCVLTAFFVWFFRDPERALPADPSKIWSPGDGRVISVAREKGASTYTIRIFLSPMDVHVQRVPVTGRVVSKVYTEGSFVAAMKHDSHGNERCAITLQPEGREALTCEQVTGFLVRRIETWPEQGDAVKAGERYGIMYFGSQCAVHLPASARPLVKVDDRVVGGVTPIAEWV
jgi:phosphatidylserine decarboxylase